MKRRLAVVLSTTALLLGGLGGTAMAAEHSPAPQSGKGGSEPDVAVVIAVLLDLCGHHHR